MRARIIIITYYYYYYYLFWPLVIGHFWFGDYCLVFLKGFPRFSVESTTL